MGFRAGLAGVPAWVALATAPAWPDLAVSIRGFDGTEANPPPALLSQTGLYDNFANSPRKPSAGIFPFRINSPLWSDGATKDRFVSPPAGQAISPTDTDAYAYPEGTVFIKNFMVDTVYGDSASRILVETRFLVLRAATDPSGNHPWHGISYHWARDQSEAYLVDQDFGANGVVNVRMGGVLRGKRWTFPSKHQCNTCHYNRGILGFITPQLNRPVAAAGSPDQLQALTDAGVLSRNPVAGNPLAHHWRGLADTSASLELRARSYFASNCSHCHGNGLSPGDHIFDFYHPEASVDQGPDGMNGAYVGKLTHQGGDGFPQFLYKGWPESSYVLKRMLVRQDFDFVPTEQMPTLATFQPDSAALGLLKDWICSLGNRPVPSCRLPAVQDDASYWDAPAALHRPAARVTARPAFRLIDGYLHVADGGRPGLQPRLLDLGGRPIPLAPAGTDRYRVLRQLPIGIYLVFCGPGPAVLVPFGR